MSGLLLEALLGVLTLQVPQGIGREGANVWLRLRGECCGWH